MGLAAVLHGNALSVAANERGAPQVGEKRLNHCFELLHSPQHSTCLHKLRWAHLHVSAELLDLRLHVALG